MEFHEVICVDFLELNSIIFVYIYSAWTAGRYSFIYSLLYMNLSL